MNAVAQTNGKNAPKPVLAALQSVALATIDPSPTQPRKTFTDIEEMAEDIKLHGVLQPVLLRAHPKKAGRFELVFGERRVRGAKLAGLKEIPGIVRELTDAEVVEIQIVENAKRSDIHPLEEAEAYETLHKKHGYSVEEIAAKVGKSTATIYSRLKFSTLVPEARKAFVDGVLTAATALLLVRIPHADLQREALKVITDSHYADEIPSAKEAARIIEEDFMMRLGSAPFDTTDATLLEKTPACATCPKRTGNQSQLFADASSKDLCTDPKCFKAKTDADWARKAEARKKKSLPVLEGKQAQEAIRSGGYVNLDATNYDDKRQRTYRECLTKTKAELPTVLARDTDGAAQELVNRKDLAKVGVLPKASARPTPSIDDAMKKEREAEKKRKEKAKGVVEQLVAKAGKIRSAAFELKFARAIAAGCVESVWHDTARGICTRREIEVPKDPREALKKHIATLDVHQCRELVVELLTTTSESTRKELAALFGVKA